MSVTDLLDQENPFSARQPLLDLAVGAELGHTLDEDGTRSAAYPAGVEDGHAPALDVQQGRLPARKALLASCQRPGFRMSASDAASRAAIGSHQHPGAGMARGRASDVNDGHQGEGRLGCGDRLEKIPCHPVSSIGRGTDRCLSGKVPLAGFKADRAARWSPRRALGWRGLGMDLDDLSNYLIFLLLGGAPTRGLASLVSLGGGGRDLGCLAGGTGRRPCRRRVGWSR